MGEDLITRQLSGCDRLTDAQYAQLAGLIYQTDPYIYPALFSGKKDAADNAAIVLSHLLKSDGDAPASEGVEFLIREALRDDPRPLFVTAQGALTDIAAALNRCPEIAEKLTVVWIGGFPYPEGGQEFNLMQDVAAGRVLMASRAAVWQLPVNVYGSMEVTMAELAARVRPCGAVGKYLYEEMEEYNLRSDEPPGLRRGENWCLGDSPVVGAFLQCEWRGNFHMQAAPRIADDMRYLPNPAGKQIRVYDAVDVRFILEDMYAKLKLFSEAE